MAISKQEKKERKLLREATPEGKLKKAEYAARVKAKDPRRWLIWSAKHRAKKKKEFLLILI
jgi:hypothetical protein